MKKNKQAYATIQAPYGSVIIVPKEVEAFKKRGIDIYKALKNLQSQIYKSPKK